MGQACLEISEEKARKPIHSASGGTDNECLWRRPRPTHVAGAQRPTLEMSVTHRQPFFLTAAPRFVEFCSLVVREHQGALSVAIFCLFIEKKKDWLFIEKKDQETERERGREKVSDKTGKVQRKAKARSCWGYPATNGMLCLSVAHHCHSLVSGKARPNDERTHAHSQVAYAVGTRSAMAAAQWKFICLCSLNQRSFFLLSSFASYLPIHSIALTLSISLQLGAEAIGFIRI